jgi:hypothetical protein
VTAIPTIAAGVTVNVVFPLTPADAAEIVVVPTPSDVANPLVAALMLIVATAASDDDHVTVFVMSWIDPSVNVPVAVNCSVLPSAIDGIAGVTAMLTRAACVTVKLVEPAIAPDVALMTAGPVATLVARPAASMVAIESADEAQTTDAVRSSVLPSV